MRPAELGSSDAKANIWVALLAFVVAGFALFHGDAGLISLVATVCGVVLVFARLRQERDAFDQRLGLEEDLARARQLIERGAFRPALAVAHDVAERARGARRQRAALELVAWCELGLGRPRAARDALSWLAESADPYCSAAVEDACGQSRWALHLLERAARKRPLAHEALLFRIDLYARLRGLDAACALALQHLARLGRDDAERVLRFAHAASLEGGAALALERALASPAAKLREASTSARK